MTTTFPNSSAFNAAEESLYRLDAEIASIIKQRFAVYDEAMQYSSEESFSYHINEFLASFNMAVDQCCFSLSSIGKRIKARLKTTLLNFYDYIVSGLWLLRESPRCQDRIEVCYFFPDSFDVNSLKKLIADIFKSDGFDAVLGDSQQVGAVEKLRRSLHRSLTRIKEVIDGDFAAKAFLVRGWVKSFEDDILRIRDARLWEWERRLESSGADSDAEMLDQIRESVMYELSQSDFYIRNIGDKTALVRHIHNLQDSCSGEELDNFLCNYALMEFLDEKAEGMSEEQDIRDSEELSELFTPEAMTLWRKLQDAGYVDSDYKPIITRRNSHNKFAIIASIMGGILDMAVLWKPFEKLWEIKNLTNKYSQAQLSSYYSDFSKEITALLS